MEKPESAAPLDDPKIHYNNITQAWKLLLGQEFHYGYFERADEPLDIATARLTRRMAERADLRGGLSVLDVGCGIGVPACFLASTYDCRVTGITTSEVGVDDARARAGERGLGGRVSFVVADGMNNGFADGSFDRIWVMESSHLMPQKDALLRECARVLRPGGRLVLCDIILHRDIALTEVMQRARDFTTLRFAFGRAKMETLVTYQRLMQGAGLSPEAVEDISEPTAPTFEHWRRNLEGNRGEVVRLIGAEAAAQFEASCEILPRLWRERVLGYGLASAVKN